MPDNVANKAYVSTGAPRVAGAIYRAPVGTSLPTSASSALNAAFKTLGYISEDGYTNSNTRDSETIKDWSGADIMTVQTGKTDEFSWTMLESLNEEVLKEIYGDDNVTGSLVTGYEIKANATELTSHAYVIDVLLNGGYIKRTVIPEGKITEISEITYKKDEAIAYEVTVTAMPDSSENTHYEYIEAEDDSE